MNLKITFSIITVILITSGIGLAYAADNEFYGTSTFGNPAINISTGEDSTSFGYGTTASGSYSTAFGYHTTASSYNSVAFGDRTTASGYMSAAFGAVTVAQPYASFVIGQFNEISGADYRWVDTDPVFVIGNGRDANEPHNAVTVLKNGNMGIGVSAPISELQVSGYIKFDTNSGEPPVEDCNNIDKIGRMKVDGTLARFYICVDGLGQGISWKTGALR